MVHLGCKDWEIAMMFDCSTKTVQRRRKELGWGKQALLHTIPDERLVEVSNPGNYKLPVRVRTHL